MYAIIDTGNQQERVEVGTVIEVDYIADAKKGDKVKFDKVLLTFRWKDSSRWPTSCKKSICIWKSSKSKQKR